MDAHNNTLDLDGALRWLKRVAGVDDDYIAKWPVEAWAEWARAMHAGNGDPRGVNPTVPTWMQPHLGRWHLDFSGPYPSVAQLWPTAHNWFAEADTHDDFFLEVEELMEGVWFPTVEQVRAAWECAASAGATPLLSITVVPAEPWGKAVAAQLEAFYVIGVDLTPQLIDQVTGIFGSAPGRSAGLARNVDEILTHADRSPLPGAEVRSWEWMYG